MLDAQHAVAKASGELAADWCVHVPNIGAICPGRSHKGALVVACVPVHSLEPATLQQTVKRGDTCRDCNASVSARYRRRCRRGDYVGTRCKAVHRNYGIQDRPVKGAVVIAAAAAGLISTSTGCAEGSPRTSQIARRPTGTPCHFITA